MKIAMLDPSLFTGRYDDSLCRALGAMGHGVTLHGRPMRATDAIVPQYYRYVPRFFRVSEAARALLGEGKAFRALKASEYTVACAVGSLADLADADIIHSQWLPFAPADKMMLKRLKKRARLIHTVHNADAYHSDAGVQGRGYRGLLSSMFDALIVHGDTTRTALIRQGVDPRHIHVTPHPPMRLAPATPADFESAGMAQRPRILFFGTIRPYKGVDLLIDACLSLWTRGAQFELAIAGKPFMDIAPLLARVSEAGFHDRLFTDLGFLTEGRLDAHMARADIIAFPYRQIDSSGAFLSALHHGKAMLTADVGMFADLPAGVVTRFPAGNTSALAQALLSLIESGAIRQAQGERARAYGEAMGDWKDMAVATSAIYETLLR